MTDKLKGDSPVHAANGMFIGPTGSDPTLMRSAVDNYDWTRLQMDRYSALLFDTVADVIWESPDGHCDATVTLLSYDDEDQTITFKFNSSLLPDWWDTSGNTNYGFYIPDPPGGGEGTGTLVADPPVQPAPMCANDKTTMERVPEGWKCPVCGFTLPYDDGTGGP